MSRWTLGRKIAVGLLLVLVQALSVGVYALWMTVQKSHKLNLISTEYIPEMQLAAQVERDLLNARIQFIYYVTIQKPGSLEKGWQRFHSAQQSLPQLRSVVGRSEAFTKLRPDVEQLTSDFGIYQTALEQIIARVQKGENHGPEFATAVAEWARRGGALVDAAGRLSHRGTEVTDLSAKEASSHTTVLILGIACAAGLIVGIGLTIFLTKDIAHTLNAIVRELGHAAEGVSGAALQVQGSAQPLAQGAVQQAASLQETSSSAEQINSMANRNADNSKAAAARMTEASARIHEANSNLEHMVGAMKQINASSGKISTILKVIEDIAFQTNILALNAAVEAARAGEAGLGFAVVADEVRNLAQRCAKAAQDTAGLIEESITSSNDGEKKLNNVALAIRSITESSTNVKNLVDEVQMGSEEQARGIALVSKAIVQMEKVTQITASHAQQNATAGEELNAQSDTLREIIGRLSSMVGSAA